MRPWIVVGLTCLVALIVIGLYGFPSDARETTDCPQITVYQTPPVGEGTLRHVIG